MLKLRSIFTTVAIGGMVLGSANAVASGSAEYDVTITNITNSISFTPILVASHRKGIALFELGAPASSELATLAEGGNVVPLATHLQTSPKVIDVQHSGGLLAPGASVTVTVSARHGAKRISLASMMLPTNDGFIALNNVRAPKKGTTTYYSVGYDAGSEPNDELCISIPGPTCGGSGGSPGTGGEDYVHINRGIHGIGDLDPAVYDWRNPVARITITKVRGNDDD